MSLLDVAIKLDHFRPFPEKEIIVLNNRLSGNFFAASLLKQLVINYMYLYPCDYKVRQRICDKLGITVEKTRMLEDKTKKEK